MGYSLVIKVILLIFGVRWCKDVFGRLQSDITVLKESDDKGHKGLIVFFWFLTLGIIILIASFAWSIISSLF